MNPYPGQTAVIELWQARLGEWFSEFRDTFLQRTTETARCYPCPVECGCWHEVAYHGPEDITAVCRCDPCRCDSFALAPDDVRLWTLRWMGLGRKLCRALNLEFRFVELNLFGTRQIGSWSVAATPVILTIQHEDGQFRQTVEALAARLRQAFILLSPTGQHLDATCQACLAGLGAACFGLDSCLRLTGGGGLQAVRAPGELFARFTPPSEEALDEDTARKAFALVKALDAGQPARKASLYTVFRLYCVEGLTSEQVARQCRCARSLIFLRLASLRRKLGRDPRQLRQYSGHFEQIEASLSEPRAKRIYRQGAGSGRAEPGEWEG